VAHVLMGVRLAAAEAGIAAYDGAFADIQDAEGFRAEAGLAARLGFTGKTCIHPSQVAVANAVFQPSAAELASALQVVGAAARADADGVGAYVVDGKMVDRPFVLRAQAIVAQAEALGLIAGKN
jgi:citrate lyase subunit beta/citryl-CoA lyase